jgi:uncharacterized membrane protein YphA (DoxX/SURF4 family)
MKHLPRIAAAVILLQTLFFKFTGAPESVHIFSTLGIEPWGRIASGVAELLAAVLLLWPRYSWAGACLAIGIMLGAVGAHLAVLGISIMDDGGLLFGLACAVLLLAGIELYRSRKDAAGVLRRFGTK